MTMGGNTIRFERGAPLDLRAALVAATQHGTVSAAQLRQCGLSASAIGRRLQAGRLHRLHRGVYVPGHRRLPPLGWTAAAVLACGPGASASHLTAAGLHALRLDSRTLIDIAVSSARRHAHARVVTHSARNLRPHDVTVVDGIPVTSPARTLLDCAPVVGPAGTAKLVAVAERLGIFDLAAVDDLLLHVRGHRGRAILRTAIADVARTRGHTESAHEDRLLAAFRAARLPEPACNYPIQLPEGAFVRPDFLWHAEGLVVEADPRVTHDTTANYRSDRVRDRRLDAIGLQTMRFNDVDLRDPAGCAREVAERLALRRAESRHEFRPPNGRNS